MYLISEERMITTLTDWSRPELFEGAYNQTADLNLMSGEQALGLVPFAKEGEFVLMLDGLLIDEKSDLTAIDFRGVLKETYTLDIARDSTGKIISIIASQ